jgi:parvulin-like peptidyl-prolyl isomerase
MTFLRKSNSFFAFCLLAFLLSWGEVCAAKVFDRVVAKVNSEIITLSTVQERMMALQDRGTNQDGSLEDLMQKALDAIIEEKLQLQEAKRLKLDVDEESIMRAIDDIKQRNNITDDDMNNMLKHEKSTLEQYKSRIKDQIMISKVVSFQMRNRINIGEKAIKLYYATHQKDFYVPDQVHPRHILFIYDDKISETQRQQKMQLAIDVLRKILDGANFVDMAKKYSEDVSASSGGDLGFLDRGKMIPAFEEAVFKLKPGEVSTVVSTSYGLHIIKLEEFKPGRTKLYREVKDEIEQILFAEKKENAYKSWMEELKKTAFIRNSLFNEKVSYKQEKVETAALDPFLDDSKAPSSSKKKGAEKKSGAKSGKEDRSNKVTGKKSVKSEPPKPMKQDGVGEAPDYDAMEKKLVAIQDLRNKNKITESEYRKRKEELLNQL